MRVLVVEDDLRVARAMARALRSHGGSVTIAATLREARQARVREDFDAVTVDAALPDGCGLDLLPSRPPTEREPSALVVSGHVNRDWLRRANAAGAGYLLKPVSLSDFKVFVDLLRLRRGSARDRISARIEEWGTKYALSPVEAEILGLRANGVDRAALGCARGTKQTTIEKQVVSLLRKTGDGSLDAAVTRLLRELLLRT